MHKIERLLNILSKLGFWNGLKICLKIATGNVNNIKLSGIKHPFSLRKKTSDIPTFYQVFIHDEYRIPPQKKPNIIIDGGSNIGLFSIKMKNEYPDSKIICIEPDFDNVQAIRKNLSPYDNIFVEHKGLWSKDTMLKISDKFNLGKWGMVVEEVETDGDVDAISINTLLKKYSIEYVDILKLDIETSEKNLFSENYEEWLPKVKLIIIELHDWAERGCSKPFFEAINKVYNNYSYLPLGENTIIINHDLEDQE